MCKQIDLSIQNRWPFSPKQFVERIGIDTLHELLDSHDSDRCRG